MLLCSGDHSGRWLINIRCQGVSLGVLEWVALRGDETLVRCVMHLTPSAPRGQLCSPFLPSTRAGVGREECVSRERALSFPAFSPCRTHSRLVLVLFPCSHINSDSFLCDCQLKWLPQWLVEKELQSFVVATCAHPESLKSKSIFAILPESFVCGKSCLCVSRLYEG